ncbi:myosin light chain kinase, smooth muscle [Lepeophtheirus salmonis]|uniref:myosin light chain kinase, smooth muscle n=1 Tax=Lepeophtheirus salmonis TaxID=72036 RepID=UPI001AE15240|nr:myosin light chain kinase, smooth muscle-like [Lepeophtheirus salmonis]XP_040568263.1 myosin light chain kinase, smooth muscle-like [Lepeophtheirus salmonis]XP_040568264.1 myosin light chain kinase, smooth muscle-like [Lepeophtheirus salmonis]XP_040568265.1 myosin light chain kinase, smooth muscle-like [Lepeophtheirus salmonis]XP_040568266.1 myosin light chain kinase, smooth muscle-like [Lepeophtheirus salmonis]
MSSPLKSITPLSILRKDYWMIEKLGCGGFSKVYLIRHKIDKTYRAAKHQRVTDSNLMKVSRREARVLLHLTEGRAEYLRKHIVNFINYFEGEGQSVILMEYLPGGELFQRISSPSYKLTEAKCRDFVRQILLGVEFIHSSGIIHLDLKPQNVVFTSNNQSSPSGSRESDTLKIIDFGLARYLESDTIPINRCGTLEFISPEVLKCIYAGTFSDMWSVGVIIFMMVSGGYSPFWAGDEYKTTRRIKRCQYAFDPTIFKSVSTQAKNFIDKLLTESTLERLSATQALKHEWMTGSYLETLKVLETTWMRKYLARRRWQRWFNAVKAMNRLTRLLNSDDKSSWDSKIGLEVTNGIS